MEIDGFFPKINFQGIHYARFLGGYLGSGHIVVAIQGAHTLERHLSQKETRSYYTKAGIPRNYAGLHNPEKIRPAVSWREWHCEGRPLRFPWPIGHPRKWVRKVRKLPNQVPRMRLRSTLGIVRVCVLGSALGRKS